MVVSSYLIGRLTSSSSCSIHPHCVILRTSVFTLPLLCRLLPSYLNSVTCGSWADCFITLPNGVQLRHMYSVFAFDTFTPLLSNASLHCYSYNSRKFPFRAHRITSSANIICQGASFMICSVSESIIIPNRKGLKADHWDANFHCKRFAC